ncbi:unnamed protein product [Calicophoron daubneyi]|uniref:Uncharacterized protein n=1 Tax=Calicophoron daubneyi TaxID=300641 RepID=A0AAV2THX4_CALDB
MASAGSFHYIFALMAYQLCMHTINASTTKSLTSNTTLPISQNLDDADVTNLAKWVPSQPAPSNRPSLSQAIIFGFVATTITNLAAAGGLVFSPLNKFRIYPGIVSFMVATAVGSLFTNALLVLIPEALGLAALGRTDDFAGQHWYVPISVAACSGSFLFFVLEFLLNRVRLTLERRRPKVTGICINHSPASAGLMKDAEISTKLELGPGPEKAMESHLHDQSSDQNGTSLPAPNGTTEDGKRSRKISGPVESGPKMSGSHDEKTSSHHLHRGNREGIYGELAPRFTFRTPHLCTKLGSVEPVVWMVIIGDGVHNFMDGLSIGASFTHSIRLGVSLSLAVLCEELPHELGDLAVLLRSGMSIPLAIFFNLASACTAYAGFFVGVFVGELSSAATYIFAVTAGFFLYISLADMLAEMHRTEEMLGDDDRKMFILFLIHCGGMLFGFGCILTITLTSGFITF